jgi:hypothetical protein
VQRGYRAQAPLDSVGHYGAHVAEDGQSPGSVSNSPGAPREPDLTCRPYLRRHPLGALDPDEAGSVTSHIYRDEDVHDIRPGHTNAIAADRDGTRDYATPARVQQRGHFPLIVRHRARDGHVYARKQLLPWTARPKPVHESWWR